MQSDPCLKAESTPMFQLKGGLYTLSSIQLLGTHLGLLDKQLDAKIKQAPKFFHNAPIVVDIQKINQPETILDFKHLKEILISKHLIPVGIKGGNFDQQQAAIQCGFPILQEGHSKSAASEPANQSTSEVQAVSGTASSESASLTTTQSLNPSSATPYLATEKEVHGSNTRIIIEPVRSGQQIYARGGDLIVLGAVSHGAELLADGHIHVYGPLRGRALAGVTGDIHAHIFCQSLEAELISIAGHYKMSEDIEKIAWLIPVDISLEQGRLHIREL